MHANIPTDLYTMKYHYSPLLAICLQSFVLITLFFFFRPIRSVAKYLGFDLLSYPTNILSFCFQCFIFCCMLKHFSTLDGDCICSCGLDLVQTITNIPSLCFQCLNFCCMREQFCTLDDVWLYLFICLYLSGCWSATHKKPILTIDSTEHI